MRLVTNQKLVDRNVAIGKYGSLGGLALLVGAFLLNLYAIGRPNDPQFVLYAFGAFLVGFTLTNVGTLFTNRWGRRPDRGLADALKGLDDRFTLYNYRLGAGHVLVGPGGVLVFVPKYQAGAITYANGKWVHAGASGGLFLRLFARDPIGNPASEAALEVDALNGFLKKRAPEASAVPQPIVVFMNLRAEVSAKEAPIPALHVKQLKEYVRRLSKGPTLSMQTLTDMEERLGFAQG